jgi:hypothetical protein
MPEPPATSRRRNPTPSGAALFALYVKISGATLSILLPLAKLSGRTQAVSDEAALAGLTGLAALTLFSAAILRWFS